MAQVDAVSGAGQPFSGCAWRVVRVGEPAHALELQQLTWAAPEPGRVLIRVAAAGAGQPDALMTAGGYLLVGEPPYGLGQEAAGEVVAVPAGSAFAVGDRVAGATAFQEGWGGYAEYTYLWEALTMRVPAGMTDEQAAGFPVGFRTAYAGLVERGHARAGQSVLVLGAAGSAGSAAVRLGKALGLTVIAVAGGVAKARFCLDHGADQVIDHRAENVLARVAELNGGRGVDLVYDLVGGELGTAVLGGLARGGLVLLVGQASGGGPSIDALQLMVGNVGVAGVLALPQPDPVVEAAVWDRLAALVADGAINTPVGSVYGFQDVPRMVAEQASAQPGKTVVRVA